MSAHQLTADFAFPLPSGVEDCSTTYLVHSYAVHEMCTSYHPKAYLLTHTALSHPPAGYRTWRCLSHTSRGLHSLRTHRLRSEEWPALGRSGCGLERHLWGGLVRLGGVPTLLDLDLQCDGIEVHVDEYPIALDELA
jgi:hypothetical protein